jgi:hypothetical protein
MSEAQGVGFITIDESLVTVVTRQQRLSAFVCEMLEAGRAGAVKDGASEEQLAQLDEAIQWLNELK